MSLRFYFGPSDGALSKRVYRDIIARSLDHPECKYLIIVPDQFTMQTQKELATMHPNGGILNIDVLSFGRLGHRVMEEVDCRDIPVLDDTGKSLVLQKMQTGIKDRLPVLGGFMKRQGYVHEVKSAISEFMQYGLSTRDLDEMIEFSKDRDALAAKLLDLKTIYESFKDYISGHFVTAEETLDVLCRNLKQSQLVRGSVIVLDGYTGFTPIQYRLVKELSIIGNELIVTMVCGNGEDPYRVDGEQKLFYLTKKTVADLERIASEAGVPRNRSEDVFLGEEEQAVPEPLLFLRRHLFRYDKSVCEYELKDAIKILEAENPCDEVRRTAIEIRRLIKEKGVAYRDIALITGNLEDYAPYVETEFARMGIPCFIDRTKGITLNPLTEFMCSALNVILKNFSYESVFHYLRSGMSGIEISRIDRLENYVLETGIRGRKAYEERFFRKTARMQKKEDGGEAYLAELNETREAFITQIQVLTDKKKDSACNYVDRLYDFLVAADAENRLFERVRYFEEQGDALRVGEYNQIYRLVMDLLNQIWHLLGEEIVTLQEFLDILTAGLGEIQVGMIPQNVDRILVGDMERTRFKPVKVLFFLGVNDGNIPRNTSKGGIISDVEREFLKDSNHALAPTPRQQMFIQRFYLYLNLHKPQQALYLMYSRKGSDGKAMRPAYLLEMIKRMFPKLQIELPQDLSAFDRVMTPKQGETMLAQALREYASGTMPIEKIEEFYTLYAAYDGRKESIERAHYVDAAYEHYEDKKLLPEISRLLYGTILENSVSRLETYATCAYRHFLKYGLSLAEREEFGFEAVDLGTIYHNVLEAFSQELNKNGRTWFDFDEVFAKQTICKVMEEQAAGYGSSVLYANNRNMYQISRMERILMRTVLTLQKQLKKGVFVPHAYELSFDRNYTLGEGVSGDERMRLYGRIDRIDLAQDDGNVYVKIVDYKSSERKFDLTALYHGLQLQLAVYMNEAVAMQKQEYPDLEVVPAAMLYYHVDDPVVEGDDLESEELEKAIEKALRTKGIVNENPGVVRLLDGEFTGTSDAIPVGFKKDGSFTAGSNVLSAENLKKLSDFVNRKICKVGREILDGRISLDPYERDQEDACKYCPYGNVCGFDTAIPGCKKRVFEEIPDEELLQRMEIEE